MRFFRILLLASGGLIVLLGLALALASNARVQTWAARRALAARPELNLTIGRVSAGLSRVVLRDVRWEQSGLRVDVPVLEVELPLLTAAWDRRFAVARLRAPGCTIDATRQVAAAPPASGPTPASPAGGVAEPGAAVAQAFAGVLAPLVAPVDFSCADFLVDGVVVLPEARGRASVSLQGGGFGPGREGKLEFRADATLADPRVAVVGLRGGLTTSMDAARSVARLGCTFELTAKGAQFPAGVQLAGALGAARGANGEVYTVDLVGQGREVLSLQAELPRDTRRLTGRWKVNMREADVAPFALGWPLPVFTATGAGEFASELAQAALQAKGHLTAAVEQLGAIRPELAALGKIRVDADFDLAEQRGVLAVERLEATLAADQPVAKVRALQSFVFNPATGELRATDATRELFGIALLDLPLAWARPFLTGWDIEGRPMRGELKGMARGGGVVLRTTAPLTIGGLAVSRGPQRLVERLDLALGATVDYNPRGWQAEIDGLTVRCGEAAVLKLDGKAGQLATAGAAVKTTGRLSADLAALLAQPALAGRLGISAGEVALEFAASLGSLREVRAKIDVTNLATVAEGKAVKLPALFAEVRADLAADGKIAFNVPITIEAEGRKSDAALTGTLVPDKNGLGAVVANLTSEQLVVDDAQALAALAGAAGPKPGAETVPAGAAVPAAPPWAGLSGAVTFALRQVIYSDTLKVSNVSGRIELDAGKVKLEGVQGGLGANARAMLNGVLTFDAARTQPYGLVADMTIKEFDPGPIFQTLNRNHPATVEGKFDISSKLSSRGETLAELATGAGGEFQLTSKGGVFRGLPAAVAAPGAAPGRVAGLLAAAGSALGGLKGKKEYAVAGSKGQALSEVATGLNAIAFDQLSVVFSRDAALNTAVREFALIAPEVRLTGGGTVLHRPGSSLLADSLAMEFKLRARGRQGELWKYLGALDAPADALGYSACTLPIRIGGSMGQPDASELNVRLAALGLEKGGVADKATDFFNKLIGGGK